MKLFYLLYLVPVTTVIYVLYGASESHSANREAPVLMFEEYEYDLGEGGPGDKLNGVLRLVNHTNKEVRFRLRASCGCTDLTPMSGSIKPQGKQDLSVSLNLPHAKGSPKTAGITAAWNESFSGAGTTSCKISGRTGYTFIASPRSISIKSNSNESDVGAQTSMVTVTGRGRAAFKNINEINVTSTAGVSIDRVEQTADSRCQIHFSLSEKTYSTPQLHTIHVKHIHTKDTCVIPVEISSNAVALVVPPVLRITNQKDSKAVEQTVRLYPLKEKYRFEVDQSRLPQGVTVSKVETHSNDSSGQIQFLVRVAARQIPADDFQINYRCKQGESITWLAQQVRVK